MNDTYQQLAEEILRLANVTINGKNPWDIQVNDSRFFRREGLVSERYVKLGEDRLQLR